MQEKYEEVCGRLEEAAARLGEVERLARAGEWTSLYDRLTPSVLGMEETPGLKGSRRRLKGDHKTAIKTRASEAADLFETICGLVSCSMEEAEADRKEALPRLRALFAAVRILMPASPPKSRSGSCWNSVILSIRLSVCCGTRTASPPRCARASGRITPP